MIAVPQTQRLDGVSLSLQVERKAGLATVSGWAEPGHRASEELGVSSFWTECKHSIWVCVEETVTS